ncbi:MAG: hypothetical protein A3E87_00410 [Gammaproteobacteria bacterium RIFCSPHIGHO2_12_FULL_35_23]|nr:MAG: hypothetical protein A3E87_00410 [Gammaproteobacteria bacterium RIFCSPHIGHO2_12_FULL_35_23]
MRLKKFFPLLIITLAIGFFTNKVIAEESVATPLLGNNDLFYVATPIPPAPTANIPVLQQQSVSPPSKLFWGNFYLQLGLGVTSQMSGHWKSSFIASGESQTHRNVSPDNTSRPGSLETIGLGFAINPIPLRFDVTYAYFNQINYYWKDWLEPDNQLQPASAKIQTQTGMFDIAYDFRNHTPWTPFLTAGIGIANISSQTVWTDPGSSNYGQIDMTSNWHSQNNFAWQAGAGINYQINFNWLVGLLVNYLNLGKAKIYFDNNGTEAVTFNAVNLSNVSVLASLIWRPAHISGITLSPPIIALHDPNTSLANRFYIQIGAGPSWQWSSSWDNTSGAAAIRSPKDTTISNVQGSIGIGYALPEWPVRFDATYEYFTQTQYQWPYLYKDPQPALGFASNYQYATSTVNSYAGMFDVSYDFVNQSSWMPFVSAGVGLAHVNSQFSWTYLNAGSDSQNFNWHDASWQAENNFAWQTAVGINYLLNSYWIVGLKANYTDLGQATMYRLGTNGTDQKQNTVDLAEYGIMATVAIRF